MKASRKMDSVTKVQIPDEASFFLFVFFFFLLDANIIEKGMNTSLLVVYEGTRGRQIGLSCLGRETSIGEGKLKEMAK